jgi:hypothetical protein
MPPARRKISQKSSSLVAMEARAVDAIPRREGWQYEPNWDGFRCLLSRQVVMAGLDLAIHQSSQKRLVKIDGYAGQARV